MTMSTHVQEHNKTGAPIKNGGAMIEVASSRQAQEVQAMMTVAKRFPRNEIEAIERIKQDCRRKKLAENARYMYPRGNTQVTGPSIRLAEAMAQKWGNIDSGVIELEQNNGESTVMAYAWDLETNTRQTKVFQVPHLRYTKKGTHALSDPRDVYEMVANQGARRLRACILGVIPGDVVDEAVEECEKTLKGVNDSPLRDRLEKMLKAFEKYNVTKDHIESRLGHKLEATTEHEFVLLRDIYNSLKDGMGAPEDYFDIAGGQRTGNGKKSNDVADKVREKIKEGSGKKEQNKAGAHQAGKDKGQQPPQEHQRPDDNALSIIHELAGKLPEKQRKEVAARLDHIKTEEQASALIDELQAYIDGDGQSGELFNGQKNEPT